MCPPGGAGDPAIALSGPEAGPSLVPAGLMQTSGSQEDSVSEGTREARMGP